MALLDLLGRRWAMGVLWTACEAGPSTFRDLQARCESISTAVLNQRLKELQAAGLMCRTPAGYAATDMGRQVYADLLPLGVTAKTWARRLETRPGAEDG
jgi:DNA-binding HxlR family transcriptional regulator